MGPDPKSGMAVQLCAPEGVGPACRARSQADRAWAHDASCRQGLTPARDCRIRGGSTTLKTACPKRRWMMDRRVGCRRPWAQARRAGRWGLTVLLVVLGLTLADHACAVASEPPSKGGTIVWAVHEGMPDFDIHYQGTYIAAQPIGPLYNGLLTFDVYDHENIVGDLAERWEIAPDGKRITFALRRGVQFHDGSDFTCADAQYSLEKL